MNLIILNIVGRSSEEGKGYPLQYSGLENSMDYIVHGVAKSQAQLSDFHFTFIVGKILRTCYLNGPGTSDKNEDRTRSWVQLAREPAASI